MANHSSSVLEDMNIM